MTPPTWSIFVFQWPHHWDIFTSGETIYAGSFILLPVPTPGHQHFFLPVTPMTHGHYILPVISPMQGIFFPYSDTIYTRTFFPSSNSTDTGYFLSYSDITDAGAFFSYSNTTNAAAFLCPVTLLTHEYFFTHTNSDIPVSPITYCGAESAPLL